MVSAPAWSPQSPFESPAPVVRLVNAFEEPYDNAVATARTCYSSRVVSPADVRRDEAARAQRDAIAKSTYDAGHHTTLQHASFQFVLENVSRQLLWSFLHAHPFYNSEQVSQRYVAVQPDRVLIPRLPPREAELYKRTIVSQMACYRDLVEILTEPAAGAFFAIFPARAKEREAHAGTIRKKAQEVARYALPIATFAHLYHTVSGLTLHRYNRLSQMLDVPRETRAVVAAMVKAVSARDPMFFASIEDPIPLEHTHEHALLKGFCRDFDRELGGLTSRLVDYKVNGEALLARAVRTVAGLSRDALGDEAAIAWVLSPAQDHYLAGALNLTSLGKLTRALSHPHYTFQKKLSHTADSQDQRHRMTPGSRPVLVAHYGGGEPDVVLPELVRSSPQATDRFLATMRETWAAIDSLLDAGVDAELALYLLPNAFPIRFEESGDLAALHHKWTTRLCYNAQEEIWHATLDEVRQVRTVHPHIGQYLGAPCSLRLAAGARPFCPEGKRFCGVPVWKKTLEQYDRVI
jgi:thymidylate synthase ThyX